LTSGLKTFWLPSILENVYNHVMLKRVAAYLLYLGVATFVVLLFVEGALRVCFGLPRGMYDIRPVGNTSLYRPSTTMYLLWTPIPYSITTNSLGFRGPEITMPKPADTCRIIALGDSITDGFYVENENTYPYQLEQILRGEGKKVDVINAGRGWSAIDIEFEMLRRFCMPLQPDVVVLTFVSNDIEELRGKDRAELLKEGLLAEEPVERSEWLLFGRTALGELILDRSLRMRFEKYRHNRAMLTPEEKDARYNIPGGDHFEENAHHYLEYLSKRYDGIAYYEQFNEKQLKTVDNYVYCLEHVHAYCKEHRIRLMLAYYPDYAEVYLPDRKFPLGGMLETACAKLDIPFLNLLPAFRKEQGKVLHLAPVDFHPNPAGNRVIAQAVAEFLKEKRLVP